ncbi:MAG: permease [Bacillota bacterium]
MKFVKRYYFAILMLLLALGLGVALPEKQGTISQNLFGNVREMVSIIPAIFVLMGLADVYVPRETVVKFMGEKSAVTGAFLAILLGSLAAGPLYAAFPIASMMMRKGASFYNVMVFLGAWSTLKVPIFLFETTSLGAAFSVTRWITNVFVIFAIAAVINATVPALEKKAVIERQSAMEHGGAATADIKAP